MADSRRKFTREFKEAAIRRLDVGASLAEVARACEVNPNLLHRWRKEIREYGAKAFPGVGVKRAEEERHRAVGTQSGPTGAGDRFFAAMLAACRGAAEAAGINFAPLVYERIEKEMSLATPLTLRRMCTSNGVSRAGFYRWRQAPEAVDRDMDLRDEIQRIALEWPSYGWRRITAELRRRGWQANHKRVKRLMREDNLLCLRRRKFLLTTDSNHPHLVSECGC